MWSLHPRLFYCYMSGSEAYTGEESEGSWSPPEVQISEKKVEVIPPNDFYFSTSYPERPRLMNKYYVVIIKSV